MNHKQPVRKKEINRTLRSDPSVLPTLIKQLVHTKKINGTLKIGSLETVHIEHSGDKLYMYAKSVRRAQKPYLYAKSAQRAQKLYTKVRKTRKHMQSCIQHCANSMQVFPPNQEAE